MIIEFDSSWGNDSVLSPLTSINHNALHQMDSVWLFNPVATLSGSLCAIAAEAAANSSGASPEEDLSVRNKPQADMRLTSGTALETVIAVDVIPEACQASASASANPSQPAKKKAKKKRASRADGKKASKEDG